MSLYQFHPVTVFNQYSKSVTSTLSWQAWKEQALNIVISKLHHDVSANLEALSIPHSNEFLTEDQLFSIDIALQDQKVAIEVDGPFHFSANTHVQLGEYPPSQLHCRGKESSAIRNFLSKGWASQTLKSFASALVYSSLKPCSVNCWEAPNQVTRSLHSLLRVKRISAGGTRCRKKLLEARGWKVNFWIPYLLHKHKGLGPRSTAKLDNAGIKVLCSR